MSFIPQLDDFKGDWLIERAIDDRLAGLAGRFEGRAAFRPSADGLRYREEGLLSFGAGAPVRATRDYLWRADGGHIAVDFADGRPFHSFSPAVPRASHRCDPDDYVVAYDFAGWPAWTAKWSVRGPRKDYSTVSVYRPTAPQNP